MSNGFRITSPSEPPPGHLPNVEININPWTQTSDNLIGGASMAKTTNAQMTKVPPLKLSHPHSPENSRQPAFTQGPVTKSQVISGEKMAPAQNFEQLPEIHQAHLTQVNPSHLQLHDPIPEAFSSNPNGAL